MSGLEAVGIGLAIPAVAQQLMNVALAGYRMFQDVKEVGEDLQKHLYALRVMEQALRDWAKNVVRHQRDFGIALDHEPERYWLVLQALAKIARTFAEVDQLERRYGIARNTPFLPDTSPPANDSSSLTIERPSRNFLHLPRLRFGRSRSRSRDSRSGDWNHLGSAAQSAPDLSIQEKLSPANTDITAIESLAESNLETPMAELDECMRKMKITAQQYKLALSTFQRYQWVIRNREKLHDLVDDLKTYMECLDTLTTTFLQNQLTLQPTLRPTLQPPAVPFKEFHVETELPFAPLPKFYGRADVLASIQAILHPAISEKEHRCQRTVVCLQGMGGIGKTQIALEYALRNKADYTAVFWIDASDPSTIDASGKRIMDELISHYAIKYLPDQQKFGSIATDLQIPGQIDNHGQLIGKAAKSPWQCVRKWLARDANIGWCLIVDGINDEADGDRMPELFPACTHGHIVATSRVRVFDSKPIEIQELGEQSSVELLLDSQIDPVTEECKAAAEVAKMLGYLPLALSQAAAYVKKKALGFVQYLRRLSKNLPQLLSEKFSRYSHGVFSCWRLSIQELIISYPNAFDLLRLCSFLSPDGVSEELVYRGLKGIEWACADELRLEKAIDGLVTYSLMKQKAQNKSKGGRIFWIHPLVQLWARESSCKGEYVFPELDPRYLDAIRGDGARSAVCLVGYGVNVEVETRESHEWIYEQENIAQVNLCCNKYFPEDKVASGDVMDEKLAWALRQLGVLKDFWAEYPTAVKLLERAVSLYKKLFAENPNVELRMLEAMYDLANLRLRRYGPGDLTELRNLIDEVESRYKTLLPPADFRALRIQSLKPFILEESWDFNGALELLQKCMENYSSALQPDHWLRLGVMQHLARLYRVRGERGRALELLDECIELESGHEGKDQRATLDRISSAAALKEEMGDYLGACECYRAAARGYEVIYGLAHSKTLSLLGGLLRLHRKLDQSKDAQEVANKIAEGRMTLKGGR